MKILRLRFKNIHSLKGENIIDFTLAPLATTGIFAITGDTGAGKSTLLDVICLALYSKTPRLGLVSKNGISEMGSVITKNTTDCYAEVEYSIENKEYRSKWAIKKARTGNFRDYEMELASLPDNEIVESKKSLVPTQNEKIIGLNYDQFVKSIVLSQGEFSRFLKAKAHERGELLEKITGTEIYRKIGIASFAKKRDSEQLFNLKKEELQNFTILTSTEVEEFIEKQEKIEKELKTIIPKIDSFNNLLKIKLKIKELNYQLQLLHEKQNKLNEKCEKFKSEENKLLVHKKLLKIKPELYDTDRLNREVQKQTDELQKCLNNYELYKKQFKEKTKQKSEIKKQYEFELQNYEKLKPSILKAKDLDNKIKNLSDFIEKFQSEFKIKHKNHSRQKQENKNLQNELNQITQESTKLKNWFEKNKIIESLSSEIPLLKSLYNDFQNKEKQFKKLLNDSCIKNVKKTNDRNSLQSEIEKEETLRKSELERLKHLIKDIKSKDVLENEINETRDLYKEIKPAILISDNYLKLLSQIEQNTENSRLFQENEDEIMLIKKDLFDRKKICSLKIDELKIRFEREQFEQKYEKDREKLSEGNECPLCGSKHHPYLKSYTNTLDKTQQNLKAQEKELKTIEKQVLDVEKELSTIIADKKNTEILALKCENEKEDLIKNYSLFAEKFQIEIQIDEKNKLIDFQNKTEKKGLELKEKIKLHNSFSKLTTEKKEITGLREFLNNLLKNIDELNSYFEKYHVYIKNLPDSGKIEILQKLSKQFSENKTQAEIIENKIIATTSQLNEWKNNEQKNAEELVQLEGKIKAMLDDASNIKLERNNTLEAKNIDSFEKSIQTKIENLRIFENKLTNEIIKLQSSIENNLDNQKKVETLLDSAQKEQEIIKQKIMPVITDLGFSNISEAKENILTNDEEGLILKQKEQLQKLLIEVNQSIKDKKQTLESEQQADDDKCTYDELSRNLSELKQKNELYNNNLIIVKSKLDTYKFRKQQFDELKKMVANLKKEYDRWSKLNSLIGDSTGKKFASFAQELTLKQLIALANKHLKLIDDRYEIIKSDTNSKDDNIFVIDRFMGNAKRSVQTLSGGESFLTSLALALGLSDLAGQNTQIESLFVDEGFGSLDRQTLDTALDALEKLQFQTKRTIGIISHVPALKERISTQIELIKTGAGLSRIQISA